MPEREHRGLFLGKSTTRILWLTIAVAASALLIPFDLGVDVGYTFSPSGGGGQSGFQGRPQTGSPGGTVGVGASRPGGGDSMGLQRHELKEKWDEFTQQQKQRDREFEQAARVGEDSLASRGFLLDAAMDYDPKLPRTVWSDPKVTLEKYQRAAAIAKKKPEPDVKVATRAITDLGHVQYFLGEFQQATGTYREALALAEKSPDPQSQGMAMNNMGAAYRASGAYDQAEQSYLDALNKFKEAGDAKGQAMTLMNRGVLARDRYQFSNSVRTLTDSLSVGPASDPLKVLQLSNLGKTYMRWGMYEKAVHSFEQAIALLGQARDQRQIADMEVSLAEVYRAWNKQDAALTRLEEALTHFKKQGTDAQRINYLIAGIYLDMGQMDKAEQYLKGSPYDAALGRLSLMKGDFKRAKKHYEKLLQSAKKSNGSEDLFCAHTGLAKAHEGLNDLATAHKHYSEAMKIVEELRAGRLLSERGAFFTTRISGFMPLEPAKGLLRLQFNEPSQDAGFYASETVRARQFADRLGLRADIRKLNVPVDVIEQEEKAVNKVAGLRKALSLVPKEKDSQRFELLSKEIITAEQEWQAFVEMLRREYPAYAAVRAPQPVTLATSGVQHDEYVLIFDVLSDGVGMKLIKGNAIIYSKFEPWKQEELAANVRAFRAPLEQVQLRGFDEQLGKRLYLKLLSDVFDKVPKDTPLMIVPDEALGALPFEALVVEGNALWKSADWGEYPEGLVFAGDLHPMIYQQSITALSLERSLSAKDPTGERLLVIADPVFQADDERTATSKESKTPKDKSFQIELMGGIQQILGEGNALARLPKTGELAKQLRKLYGESCEIHTGMEASRQFVLNELAPQLPAYRYLIFATHAFAGENVPGILEPFLLLTAVPAGTDPVLSMTDILGLDLRAEVAFVTACQTGYGKHVGGEGIMSLGRAFQCAGAKTSLMSLWSVSETSSVALVESFFKCLKEGNEKLEAWQKAKKDLRKSGFDHPFFWASFVLSGDVNPKKPQ
ncbi:MAG: CHAT domain-containing protein [Desulfomonilaceae bacterium]